MSSKKKLRSLEEIIPLLTADALKVAGGMIEDALFMEDQLAKLREVIKTEGCSENYQYGSKQTASMTSYLQIQKQYGVIIKYLTELIPNSSKKGVEQSSDDLLEFLRDR